jgi:hypothetical protein
LRTSSRLGCGLRPESIMGLQPGLPIDVALNVCDGVAAGGPPVQTALLACCRIMSDLSSVRALKFARE